MRYFLGIVVMQLPAQLVRDSSLLNTLLLINLFRSQLAIFVQACLCHISQVGEGSIQNRQDRSLAQTKGRRTQRRGEILANSRRTSQLIPG
jgi:hypothetical protein